MIKFQKYHACGNNFIIIEDQNLTYDEYQKLAIKMCNYNTGIGADGLIIVKTNPLEMVFYNQDGTRGKMCGNGVRCFGKYVLDNIYPDKEKLLIQTLAGEITIDVINKDPILFRVDMGKPSFDKQTIGMYEEYRLEETIVFENKQYQIYNLFMGVTHTVVFVDNLEKTFQTKLGEYICYHPMFVDRTNVDFVEIISRNEIKMKTYERGVGWTKACGSGASASSYVMHKYYNLKRNIRVYMEYGYLDIEIKNNVYMIGSARKIGEVIIEEEFINA